MKNKLIISLSILLVMLLLPFVKVNAASMDSYIDWNLDRSIFAHQYRSGSDHITNLAMITANGNTAYCIEPGIVADKGGTYNSTNDINDTNLKNKNIKKLSLIGYYGYGYTGHNVKEYYMAAQELIWREMGVENVWWTDKKEGGNTLNIESYKSEIMNLVNKYEISPEFDFKNKYIVGDELSLNDKNNVLNGYELLGNADIKIEGNNIKIKVKAGDNSFNLRRKQNGKATKFYYKSGYQTIGSFEFPYNYEKKYNINYTYAKVIVDKLDLDTNSKVPSSLGACLEGAIYGLYDESGKLLASKETDKQGKVIFDNLPKGNYFIKELKPSIGYTVDSEKHSFSLDTNNLNTTIKSYERIIKNKVVITKVLDNEKDKTCTPEQGILFYVYDERGNFVMEKTTDENGNITLELAYGKYILRQITSLDGVDKVKDKIIEVTKDGIVQNITLVNHNIKLPKTGKKIYGYLILFSLLIAGVFYEKKLA